MVGRAHVLVTEIFDSELLGEGLLPTLRDAVPRLLEVRSNAPVGRREHKGEKGREGKAGVLDPHAIRQHQGHTPLLIPLCSPPLLSRLNSGFPTPPCLFVPSALLYGAMIVKPRALP